MRTLVSIVVIASVAALAACEQAPTAPAAEVDVHLAPGGNGGPPNSAASVSFVIHDELDGVDAGLTSDGAGAYSDGECGVDAWLDDVAAFMNPTGERVGRNEVCDVLPRSATVTLAVRHVSDDPHVDETLATPLTGSMTNVKLGHSNGRATINVPLCAITDPKSGKTRGLGLRFNPEHASFPGSDFLDVTDDGTTLRFTSKPYPDNVAGCENEDGVSYWHVDVDLEVVR